MKSTGRRMGDDGSYWITYPDGSEVQVCGEHGLCVLSFDKVFAEFRRAAAFDESVISGLKMLPAHRVDQLISLKDGEDPTRR